MDQGDPPLPVNTVHEEQNWVTTIFVVCKLTCNPVGPLGPFWPYCNIVVNYSKLHTSMVCRVQYIPVVPLVPVVHQIQLIQLVLVTPSCPKKIDKQP